MDSKRPSKLPEKRIFKLKENGLWQCSEVVSSNPYPNESQQANKARLPISANAQLTLKPGASKGVKPSMCFCKPPTKQKSSNENSREPSLEIPSRGVSRVDGENNAGSQQRDYSQYYIDILSKESSRTSAIQHASWLSSSKQYERKNTDQNHCNQPNDNLKLSDNKQIGCRQTDEQRNHEQLNGKLIHNSLTDREENCDEQIDDKQSDGKQKDDTHVDDGKECDPMCLHNVDGQPGKEMQSSAKKNTSVCGICLQEFPTTLSLEKHRKQNGHYLCGECGEALTDEAAFKEHLKKKMCKKAVCMFCGEKFITRAELENHKAVVHHKCLECNKLYNSAEKLLAHKERHHGSPYMCLECGQKFSTRALCKKHSTNRHKKEKYYCPECGRGFTRMSLLKRHATYTHSDAKNFECEICKKSFKRPDALKIHMITHSNNKPFHCEKCGKQFTQKVCYTKHLPCKKPTNKTKSQNIALPTMAENMDNFGGEPRALAEHLMYSLSKNDSSELLENVCSSSVSGEINRDNSMKKSARNVADDGEISMGCRCPPTCRCKKFSIGIKVQTEEPKGPTLDTSEEIASVSCCCDIELMDIPISD